MISNTIVLGQQNSCKKQLPLSLKTPFRQIAVLKLVLILICGSYTISHAQYKQEDFPILAERKPVTVGKQTYQIVAANGIKAFIAGKNQTVSQAAVALNKDSDDLRAFNDMERNESSLQEGKVYYLYEKFDVNGNADFHVTEPGETLWDISQRYAIELKEIAKRNRMSESETPQVGRVIFLNEKRGKRTPVEIKQIDQVPVTPPPAERLAASAKADEPQIAEPANGSSFADVKERAKSVVKAVVSDTANYYIVKQGENIFAVEKNTGVKIEKLQEYNPALDLTQQIEAGTAIRKTPMLPNIDPYPTKDGDGKGRRAHMVMAGENPSIIAAKYRITEQQLYDWNGVAAQDISPGMYLFVEPEQNNTNAQPDKPAFVMPTADEIRKAEDNGQHIFLPTDTQQSVADKYNVKVSDLRQWNNLCHDDMPQPGDKLYIISFAVPVNYMKPCPDKKPEPVVKSQIASASGAIGQAQAARQIQASNPDNMDPSAYPTSMPVPSYNDPEMVKWPRYHTVVMGDGLWSISKKYGQSVDQIRAWNNLPDNQINKGQKLLVGYVKSPLMDAPKGQVAKFHNIKRGETVWSIAKKFRLDINQLREMNGLQSDHIVIGERIFVGYEPGLPQFHTVKAGETVESISKRFRLVSTYIRVVNGLTVDDQLATDQKIRLK